jgi:hypothetical protein
MYNASTRTTLSIKYDMKRIVVGDAICDGSTWLTTCHLCSIDKLYIEEGKTTTRNMMAARIFKINITPN